MHQVGALFELVSNETGVRLQDFERGKAKLKADARCPVKRRQLLF